MGEQAIWPVAIPSRGRPEGSTTRLLRAAGIYHELVVEPHEAEEYAAANKNVTIRPLLASGQGLSYARNAILARGVGWFWMMDDDVQGFFRSQVGKCVKTHPREVLGEAQTWIEKHPHAAQGALEYQQFAWRTAKPGVAINGYADVVVAINAERVRPVRYRAETDMKEDRDFTLQLLSRGHVVVRTRHLAFGAPKNGSNAGGWQPEYQAGREKRASRALAQLWPRIVTESEKADGRPDAKINWGVFRKPLSFSSRRA